MNTVEGASCAYCGTEFTVEFEREDDELVYCPACGEMLLEEDENEDYDELYFEDE
jgi:predicted  nucleic acid-binding Zn-ribbon protein